MHAENEHYTNKADESRKKDILLMAKREEVTVRRNSLERLTKMQIAEQLPNANTLREGLTNFYMFVGEAKSDTDLNKLLSVIEETAQVEKIFSAMFKKYGVDPRGYVPKHLYKQGAFMSQKTENPAEITSKSAEMINKTIRSVTPKEENVNELVDLLQKFYKKAVPAESRKTKDELLLLSEKTISGGEDAKKWLFKALEMKYGESPLDYINVTTDTPSNNTSGQPLEIDDQENMYGFDDLVNSQMSEQPLNINENYGSLDTVSTQETVHRISNIEKSNKYTNSSYRRQDSLLQKPIHESPVSSIVQEDINDDPLYGSIPEFVSVGQQEKGNQVLVPNKSNLQVHPLYRNITDLGTQSENQKDAQKMNLQAINYKDSNSHDGIQHNKYNLNRFENLGEDPSSSSKRLPQGVYMKVLESGTTFFVNDVAKTTTIDDPRTGNPYPIQQPFRLEPPWICKTTRDGHVWFFNAITKEKVAQDPRYETYQLANMNSNNKNLIEKTWINPSSNDKTLSGCRRTLKDFRTGHIKTAFSWGGGNIKLQETLSYDEIEEQVPDVFYEDSHPTFGFKNSEVSRFLKEEKRGAKISMNNLLSGNLLGLSFKKSNKDQRKSPKIKYGKNVKTKDTEFSDRSQSLISTPKNNIEGTIDDVSKENIKALMETHKQKLKNMMKKHDPDVDENRALVEKLAFYLDRNNRNYSPINIRLLRYFDSSVHSLKTLRNDIPLEDEGRMQKVVTRTEEKAGDSNCIKSHFNHGNDNEDHAKNGNVLNNEYSASTRTTIDSVSPSTSVDIDKDNDAKLEPGKFSMEVPYVFRKDMPSKTLGKVGDASGEREFLSSLPSASQLKINSEEEEMNDVKQSQQVKDIIKNIEEYCGYEAGISFGFDGDLNARNSVELVNTKGKNISLSYNDTIRQEHNRILERTKNPIARATIENCYETFLELDREKKGVLNRILAMKACTEFELETKVVNNYISNHGPYAFTLTGLCDCIMEAKKVSVQALKKKDRNVQKETYYNFLTETNNEIAKEQNYLGAFVPAVNECLALCAKEYSRYDSTCSGNLSRNKILDAISRVTSKMTLGDYRRECGALGITENIYGYAAFARILTNYTVKKKESDNVFHLIDHVKAVKAGEIKKYIEDIKDVNALDHLRGYDVDVSVWVFSTVVAQKKGKPLLINLQKPRHQHAVEAIPFYNGNNGPILTRVKSTMRLNELKGKVINNFRKEIEFLKDSKNYEKPLEEADVRALKNRFWYKIYWIDDEKMLIEEREETKLLEITRGARKIKLYLSCHN